MSKAMDKRFEQFNKMFDDLLGSVEDWSSQEVDQFLASAGVDVDAANRALYERVSEIAGSYRAKSQNVPIPVAEFLQHLRPIDLPTSDPKVAKSAARRWVANLRKPRPSSVAPQVAYAFRNRKEQLGSKDRSVLEGLEAKLKNRKRSDDA